MKLSASGIVLASLLAIFVLPKQSWAVDCLAENLEITLTTQVEVDNFQATYGGGRVCDRVTGYLTVFGLDITSLEGLSDITRVDESLRFHYTSAINLNALANLTSVGQSLLIDENDALTSISGLTNLNSLGRTLRIARNPKLTNLNGLANLNEAQQVLLYDNSGLTDIGGLANLTSLTGVLSIYKNVALTNLDGLTNIIRVGGDLEISSNTELADISALANLTDIGGWLLIDRNNLLTNIDALVNVTSVGPLIHMFSNPAMTNIDGLASLTNVGRVAISDHAGLVNIDGLANVTNVEMSIDVYDNPALTNIDGLANVSSVGQLTIRENSSLMECSAVAPLLGWPDGPPNDNVDFGIIVENNSSGCNSVQEILDSYSDSFQINAGFNDAWYNPITSGQGFFISVFPDLGVVSLAWFTYDTERPPDDAQANLGDAGHRWLTAIGPIDGNQVLMNIEMTSGGLFDTPTDIQRTDPPGSDGTIILTFTGCNLGTVEYDIPNINGRGVVPIQRVAGDNIALCEALSMD